MSLQHSLFSRGLTPRLAVAVVYGALAAWSVALVARPDSPAPATRARLPEINATHALVCIQSIEPVGSWDVRLDGRALSSRIADDHTWLGEADVLPGSALVVDAAARQSQAPSRAANALRIRIAGTTPPRDETIWCERTWSAARRVDQFAAAAAPIDPADLP